MPAFRYQAVDRGGRRVSGRSDATTSDQVARLLTERGLVVLGVDASAPMESGALLRSTGATRRGTLEATRALAALLPAGMPLARVLGAAESVVTDARTVEVLNDARTRVERGESLATSLAHHPTHFSALYVGLVRAGERSGSLAGVFGRLATQLEREEQLRARLISASIYPLLLALTGGVAVLILLVFVLPRFADLLAGSGASLPRSTAFLLTASGFARERWYLLAAFPVAVAALGAWHSASESGRRAMSAALLRVPLVGALRRDSLAARFARLVSVLLGGGAPLLAALDDTTGSLSDPLARDEALRVRGRLREGSTLSAALADGSLFPPLLAQLAAVGEEAGRLEELLGKAADILEERTERATQRLVALAEPAMIAFFGVVVGFVALSLLQAIYGVNAGAFR